MKTKFGRFGLVSRLGRDERGSIMIQATVIVVAIMGMIGLALDGGRFFMAHNDLQDLADAAALAGAKKLDATTGSMDAATTAANNVGGANNVRWWDVSAAKVLSVQFYKTLADLDANSPATLDKNAVYIKVTTGAWQVAPTFLAAVGASSNNRAQATAVAESGTSLCVPASMMLCNPIDDRTTPSTSNFTPRAGTMYVFSTNGNATFSPGVFNLLDNENGCGSDPCVKGILSRTGADICASGGTSPAQGSKQDATIDGINVRFEQSANGTGIVDSSSAPIVIDGLIPGTTGGRNPRPQCAQNQTVPVTPCTGSPLPPACTAGSFQQTDTNPSAYDVSCNIPIGTAGHGSCPLPRDRSLVPSVPGSTGSALVGGTPDTADLQAYWQNQHGTSTLPSIPIDPDTSQPVAPRDFLYQLEVANNVPGWPNNATEARAPVCNLPASTDFKRRRVPVAIVNCAFWEVAGNSVNHIRTDAYGEFFITEPVPRLGANKGQIYVEFVKKHNIDETGSQLHSFVRLVR